MQPDALALVASSRGWKRWLPVLAAVLPAFPLLLTLWVDRVPPDPERVIPLTGEWLHLEGDSPAGADPSFDDSALAKKKIPGRFETAGPRWIRRHITLPPPLRDKTLYLTLGYIRSGWVELYVNGVHIGGKGVRSSNFILEQGIDGWYVPASVLRSDGDNVIAVFMDFPEANRGIATHTFFLGDDAVLKRHALEAQAMKHLLELGALLTLVFLGAIVAILLVLSWKKRETRRRNAAALGLTGAVALYLLGKGGTPLAFFLDPERVQAIVMAGVNLVTLGSIEFVEEILFARTTVVRRVSRVVCLGMVPFALAGVSSVYTFGAPFSFFIVLWVFALTVRALLQSNANAKPVLVTTQLLIALAGANDLLADMGIWTTPRLFAVASGNFGVLAALIVIIDFMQLAQDNEVLSSSLATRNAELAKALVETQEAARLKSEFLANTSHELRTPLNSIINIPQGLIEQYEDRSIIRCAACESAFEPEEGDRVDETTACPSCAQAGTLALATQLQGGAPPEDQVRYLRSVVASGKHLLAIVNDILDFSKLEAGRLELHLEEVDAVQAVSEAVETTAAIAETRGIQLAFAPAAEPARLTADRVKLVQIVINLVSNAVKFSPDGSVIELRVLREGDDIVIEVQDHGIGIAPEHQQLIFESFRQVEGGHTRRYAGTGLGLAITKRLVELHQGQIGVKSALGEGSTFRVVLPRERDAPAPMGMGAASAPPALEGKSVDHVLLVDDQHSALATIELSIRPLGVPVRTLNDPLQVMAQLRAHRPRLLILDVMMPRKSGLEILRELRAEPSLRDLPVLVVSAYHDNEIPVRKLGATWLAKPWQPGAMLELVTIMLSGEDPARQARAAGDRR